MNTVLSFIIIALLVICLIMLVMIYSKKGTSSGELIKQQIELSSKATDDKISKLSSQMRLPIKITSSKLNLLKR